MTRSNTLYHVWFELRHALLTSKKAGEIDEAKFYRDDAPLLGGAAAEWVFQERPNREREFLSEMMGPKYQASLSYAINLMKEKGIPVSTWGQGKKLDWISFEEGKDQEKSFRRRARLVKGRLIAVVHDVDKAQINDDGRKRIGLPDRETIKRFIEEEPRKREL